MSEPAPHKEYRELDSAELIELLRAMPADVPVEVVVEDPNGNEVITEVVRLRVGWGTDFDRSGGYQWTRIVARMEPHAGQRVMRPFKARDVPMGSVQPVWTSEGGSLRKLVDRVWDGPQPGYLTLVFDDGSQTPYPADKSLTVYPPDQPL